MPEITILKILKIYTRPTENSKISTFELDFQFSPHKEMFEKSGDVLFNPEKKIIKNEIPIYEIVSGAALTFAALLMILPGFLTDGVGLLIIFPWTRKIILRKISKKNYKKKNFIEGEYEDIDEQK